MIGIVKGVEACAKFAEQLGKIMKPQQANDTMDLFKCDGRRFKAVINHLSCQGKVRVEDGEVYLCQNKKEGSRCKNTFGYLYSWRVSDRGEIYFDDPTIQVKNFRLTDMTAEEIETYKDWQVGDKVRNLLFGDEMDVIFRSGELVVCKSRRGTASHNFTCKELYDRGYRLVADPVKEEPEIVEMSVPEIEKELGMKAGTLRIKKDE